ncbi:Gfo/Idh/MocA family protein [Pleomorphovibrio marinus]|uniref:Gfo/Idh/MocA family protein n=1 Tax=Pleomorphovibrio marinus TaxID=2164132 RepID=UPI000E0CB726|nr:Gfo/Idh/MocA family oxidoreductase [Pleomorphovibrio marinus]
MSTLKGVMVGAGYFSQFHAEAWQRSDLASIVAICDQEPAKAKKIAQIYGIPRVYTDAIQMFSKEQPDFVDIVTPPKSHYSLIAQALELGIPVMCQKPLADTFEEVQEIVSLLENHPNVRFMVHENWRFQPWYRELRALKEQGVLGEKIFHLAFRMRTGDGWGENAYKDRQPYFREMPRLLVHETGVHFVDTFRYLEGEIEEVYAQLRTLNQGIKGEDSGLILFNFASGATGLFDASRYNEPYHNNPRFTFGQMLIEGDAGSVQLDNEGYLWIKPLGKAPYKHPFEPSLEGVSGDSVFACLNHFANNLISGEEFETCMEDYLKTLQVVEAIYRSQKEGKKIALEKVFN